MTNPETQWLGNNLSKLTPLYPDALAMAVASNSRARLAARRWATRQTARLNTCGAYVGLTYEIPHQPPPTRRYTLPDQLTL